MDHDEKIPLGGMALDNGVFVQSPSAWGCAVRLPNGELRVKSGRKAFRAGRISPRFLRNPARVAEAFVLLSTLRRQVPDAKLPFRRPAVLAALAGSVLTVHSLRRSDRLSARTRDLATVATALLPAGIALGKRELAEYHGAEHTTIGTYEHGEPRSRVHERCGSNLVLPMLAGSLVANAVAMRLPRWLRPAARVSGQIAAIAGATELLDWAVRNPERPLARAFERPGQELQRRLSTAEPSEAQLEVARAALDACLEVERKVE